MPTLQVFPPDADNQSLLSQIPGVRETPVPVVAFDGPDGHLGPEAAGAVLVLHMTMVDEEATQAFWRQVAITCRAAAETEGFIRMISFFDGLANWALGFWRTVGHAQAFAKSHAHLDAIRDMHAKRFEYTHFASLFAPVAPRPRDVWCERCGAELHMPLDRCPGCGNELADVFVQQQAVRPPWPSQLERG